MKFLWCLFIVALCAMHIPSFWALNAFPALPEVSATAQNTNGLNTKTGSNGETNTRIYESKKEVTVYMRGQKGRASSGGGTNAHRPIKNSASALVNNPTLFMLSTTVFSGSLSLALAFLS